MTHSVLQVYKRFHGNFYWVLSKLSKTNSRNISNDPSTIVNIWKHYKTKFAAKNDFCKFLPVKLKSNTLQATSISKWNMLCLGQDYVLHSRLFVHMKRAKSKYNIWKNSSRFHKYFMSIKHFCLCDFWLFAHQNQLLLAGKDQ